MTRTHTPESVAIDRLPLLWHLRRDPVQHLLPVDLADQVDLVAGDHDGNVLEGRTGKLKKLQKPEEM